MSGWKTYSGGAALILIGVGLLIREVNEGTYNIDGPLSQIATGLAILGIGHKVEKTKKVLEEVVEPKK